MSNEKVSLMNASKTAYNIISHTTGTHSNRNVS